MELWTDLKEVVENLEKDVNAFYAKGNKAAGKRVRAAMQTIKALSQQIRKDVSAIKNGATDEA